MHDAFLSIEICEVIVITMYHHIIIMTKADKGRTPVILTHDE
jgi:hypothetical protein